MKTATIAMAALALAASSSAAQTPGPAGVRPTIVLVHGAFVDGSGWAGVHRALTRDGYRVIVVQNPTTSLAADVAATRRAIAEAGGPVVLVGHSWGGAVITEAGSHPDVRALVYVAAFAPDKGESVSSLGATPHPGAPPLPVTPTPDGYLLIDRSRFAAAFAADLDPATARFMADSQTPWPAEALAGAVTEPGWKLRPSWYLVAADDRIIPPAAQRQMAGRAGAIVREAPGSHAGFIADPAPLTRMITEAASAAAGGRP